MGLEEEAEAPVVDAGVVADDGEVADTGVAQGEDEGFGDAAEDEASDGEEHAVADDVGEGGAGVGVELGEGGALGFGLRHRAGFPSCVLRRCHRISNCRTAAVRY